MSVLTTILRRNTSRARIAGFVISNFIGLAIVGAALQFWLDTRSIFTGSDSCVSSDLLVVNRRLTARNTLGESAAFSQAEIDSLRKLPWVRSVDPFTASQFSVRAAIGAGSLGDGSRSMSTYMFFESIPGRYVDIPPSRWQWREGDREVPIILPKDYLALYNFGFAASAGLPQLTEGLMQSLPIRLVLSSETGERQFEFAGRIAGFTNRLNTILVPDNFMQWANAKLGDGTPAEATRIAIDTNSPGDSAITDWLEARDLETAGDKSASQAAFLLKTVIAVVAGVGILITILSLAILILSLSLIMERNRDRIHTLLMLGYPLRDAARPYIRLAVISNAIALATATGAVFTIRTVWLPAVARLGGADTFPWLLPLVLIALSAAATLLNILSIRRSIRSAWR